jgi:hypothetical protein
MLAMQQQRNRYVVPRFEVPRAAKPAVSATDLLEKSVFVISLERPAMSVRITSSRDITLDGVLEIIDELRKPLAIRRIKGEALSESDAMTLKLLNDMRKSFEARRDGEPLEVVEAVDEARRILASKKHGKASNY